MSMDKFETCVLSSTYLFDLPVDLEETVVVSWLALKSANSLRKLLTSVSNISSLCVLWVALEFVGELTFECVEMMHAEHVAAAM